MPQPLVAGPVNRTLPHPIVFCLAHALVLITSGTWLSLIFNILCFSPSHSLLSMCKLSSGFLQISCLKSDLFISVIYLQKLTQLSLSVTFRSRAGNWLNHISSLWLNLMFSLFIFKGTYRVKDDLSVLRPAGPTWTPLWYAVENFLNVWALSLSTTNVPLHVRVKPCVYCSHST